MLHEIHPALFHAAGSRGRPRHAGKNSVNGRTLSLAAGLMAALALAACGNGEEGKKPASQLAAKVNSGEISIHQVNFALRQAPEVAPEQFDQTKRRVLDELVDQELVVQEAVAAKLDRSPNVLQALEANRREILARAYLDQAASAVAQPDADEIGSYYRQHPELFGERKIYRLREIDLPATPEIAAAVRQQLARSSSAAEVLNLLAAKGIKVPSTSVVKPAEGIELEFLPRLAGLKEGQAALFESADGATVTAVIATFIEPLSEDEARPLIAAFLRRQRGQEIERETKRQLREKARIEYLGEFSSDGEAAKRLKAAEESRKLQAAQAARDAARQASAAEAESQAATLRQARNAAEALPPLPHQAPGLPAGADNGIARGVAGLK